MGGYCVGEPWNAVAVQQGIGFTHLATQDMWQHHPEKALVVNDQASPRSEPTCCSDVMGAVLEACAVAGRARQPRRGRRRRSGSRALRQRPARRASGAGSTGDYDLGAGLGETTFDGDQMRFFRDGARQLPPPVARHLVPGPVPALRLPRPRRPPYAELADELILTRPLRRGGRGRGRRRPRRRHGAVRGQARRRHVRSRRSPTRRRPAHDATSRPRRRSRRIGPARSRAAIAGAVARRRRPAPSGAPTVRRAAARRSRARRCRGVPLVPRVLRRSSASRVARRGLWQLVGAWRRRAARPRPTTFTEMRDAARRPVLRQRPATTRASACSSCELAQRVFKGFALAALVGVPLGLLHRRQPAGPGRRSTRSSSCCGPVSPLAWFPIWLMVLQDAAQGAVWVDLHHRAVADRAQHRGRAWRRCPSDQRNVARVFRFGRLAYLRHVLVPTRCRRSSPGCGCRWASPGW